MELQLSARTLNNFIKHGLGTVESVQNFFPRKYHDYTKVSVVCPENDGKNVLLVGKVFSIESSNSAKGMSYHKAKMSDGHAYFTVFWFGYFDYRLKHIERAVVGGKLKYSNGFYSISNPDIFDDVSCLEAYKRVVPVYKKLDGISADMLVNTIGNNLVDIPSYKHDDLKMDHHLLFHEDAVRALHNPKSLNEVRLAKESLAYEEIYDYIENLNDVKQDIESKFTSINDARLKNYIKSLPFNLTSSQENTVKDILMNIRNGKCVNALIQGDVGSGKTAVAFSLICAINAKSVLMAPTIILAKQHYEAFKPVADMLGIKVALVASNQKNIEDADVIIGTHGVINLDIDNLGLIITDEEHRFGVECREKLHRTGIHKVSMSATPIPRTLAESLYNGIISVYDLELPSERKPVKTYYLTDFEMIAKNIEFVLDKGDQIYIVCPKIEEDETLQSVEEMYKFYKKRLNVPIGCITSKTKKAEAEEIMSSFKDGSIKVLVATTVIEVGVNVPNANLIVIHNAERFGIAQLHQLRGRVGRGSKQGYCILESKVKTERIEAMLKTTNGFELAEEDLRIRGAGNLLGTEQSGKNEIIDLIMEYPNVYKMVKEDLASG